MVGQQIIINYLCYWSQQRAVAVLLLFCCCFAAVLLLFCCCFVAAVVRQFATDQIKLMAFRARRQSTCQAKMSSFWIYGTGDGVWRLQNTLRISCAKESSSNRHLNARTYMHTHTHTHTHQRDIQKQLKSYKWQFIKFL